MTEKKPRTSGANEQRAWTSKELQQLSDNGHLGAAALAELLDRTASSVVAAAYRSRISLRRPGSRRGSVLGQPRGVSLRAEIREDLVSGRVSADLIAQRLKIDRDAALCPSCGRRPVRERATGLCRVCHLERLTAAHLEVLDELDAKRGLWTSRTALKRARRGEAT